MQIEPRAIQDLKNTPTPEPPASFLYGFFFTLAFWGIILLIFSGS